MAVRLGNIVDAYHLTPTQLQAADLISGLAQTEQAVFYGYGVADILGKIDTAHVLNGISDPQTVWLFPFSGIDRHPFDPLFLKIAESLKMILQRFGIFSGEIVV